MAITRGQAKKDTNAADSPQNIQRAPVDTDRAPRMKAKRKAGVTATTSSRAKPKPKSPAAPFIEPVREEEEPEANDGELDQQDEQEADQALEQQKQQRMNLRRGPALLKRENFRQLQYSDHFCNSVINYLTEKTLPPDNDLAMQVMTLSNMFVVDEDGLLQRFCHSRRGQVLAQWVVPLSLQPLLLKLAHDDLSAAHAGVQSTFARLYNRYFWIGMNQDVTAYVTSCILCQRRKAATSSKVQQIPVPPRRLWQRMTVDLLDCRKETERGNKYIIAFVETLSGFCFLFALKSKKAEEIAECFHKVVLEVGAVEELGSDNGGEFDNEIMAHLCKAFHIKKTFSSSHHPQANGLVERLNSRILQAAYSFSSTVQDQWDLHLSALQFALRTTPRSRTGISPFFAVYCREPMLPHDIMMGNNHDRALNLHEDVEHRLTVLAQTRKIVEEHFEKHQAAVERENAKIRRWLEVSVGDLVMVALEPQQGRSGKLDARWTGPWRIIQQADTHGVTYICKLEGRETLFRVVHKERMKRFKQRPAQLDSSDLIDQISSVSDSLEQIVDRKSTSDGDWQYLFRPRDEGEPVWLTEREALKTFTTADLDTFHALYELKHEDQMPHYASRQRKAAKTAALSKEEALQMFPLGTKVARESDEGDLILGEIAGYLRPWWRARFTDGVWVDLSKTEVIRSLRLKVPSDATRRAPTQPDDSSLPMLDSHGQLLAEYPEDFHQTCKGVTINFKWNLGWFKGKVIKPMDKKGKHYYEVHHEGDTHPRDTQLDPDKYTTNFTSPEASWNIVDVNA
jgi:hypothetical protein